MFNHFRNVKLITLMLLAKVTEKKIVFIFNLDSANNLEKNPAKLMKKKGNTFLTFTQSYLLVIQKLLLKKVKTSGNA